MRGLRSILLGACLVGCGCGKAKPDAGCPGPYSSAPCVTGTVCEYSSPLACDPGCSGGSYSSWECIDGQWQDTTHTAGAPACYCPATDAQTDDAALDAGSADDVREADVDSAASDAEPAESSGPVCGAAGAACPDQRSCSSGDDVDVGCRSFLICQSGTLKATTSTFIRCGATAGSACSASQPDEGAACTVSGQTCSYASGTCTCATGCESPVDAGPCQKPRTWHCASPSGAGCPSQAPQLGAGCLDENATCAYGSPCYQYEVKCSAGYWEPFGALPLGGCQ